jgi:sn-glycerol 3-phosphate transport system ATP-binding protein
VATLAFRGVRKHYGKVRALEGLDLEVADGELMVVLGPSGCGKTTALRLAAGLDRVTAGTVHIGDRDVTVVAPAARNVAMVFQNYALFPHLTVAANIGIGLAVRRVPKGDRVDRIRAAAALVGCESTLDRRPSELSGGERQRVALARALVREPDVFLLDEPLSNLDAQLRVHMRAELRRLQHRLGATMVYVTHDQVEALTMSDRIAVLGGGVLQQVASPEEAYRQPANRFVATFIGSPAMNILPARVNGAGLYAGPLRLDYWPMVGAFAGRRLELGIRPEHVRVAATEPADGVPADVEVVELAGNETYLHLRAGEYPLVARVAADFRPRVGSRVQVGVPADRAYLFDADSGQTLVQAR